MNHRRSSVGIAKEMSSGIPGKNLKIFQRGIQKENSEFFEGSQKDHLRKSQKIYLEKLQKEYRKN